LQNLKLTEEEVSYEIVHKKVDLGYLFFKRTADIICSLLGIIILSPVLLFVSIAIRLGSKGKAIFVQERVGHNGKLFRIYKFRSMDMDAEIKKKDLVDKNEMSGPMFKIKEDPRVTKIGKFIRRTSIDELPQLFNVLKGEMSLVGPRPSLPDEVDKFEDWMMERLEVKPGITCYWQVSGRNNIDFEDWMKLDIKYVREKSVLVDIKMIFKTALLLFGDEHAS
jgi:exopolysaccharide biosynthesis polyprenyl glycosylphosphotransferase